jgi:hypothetical protein
VLNVKAGRFPDGVVLTGHPRPKQGALEAAGVAFIGAKGVRLK